MKYLVALDLGYSWRLDRYLSLLSNHQGSRDIAKRRSLMNLRNLDRFTYATLPAESAMDRKRVCESVAPGQSAFPAKR